MSRIDSEGPRFNPHDIETFRRQMRDYHAYLAIHGDITESEKWGDDGVRHPRYLVDRSRIVNFVFPDLLAKLITNDVQGGHTNVEVLMLGDGKGMASMALARRLFPAYKDCLHIVSTSLNPMDTHPKLKSMGIDVRIGILAEVLASDLKKEGLGTFDFICTDSVLLWANQEQALPQLRASLKPGGVWFCIENGNRNTIVWTELAENLQKAHMQNVIPEPLIEEDGHRSFVVKYVRS